MKKYLLLVLILFSCKRNETKIQTHSNILILDKKEIMPYVDVYIIQDTISGSKTWICCYGDGVAMSPILNKK